MDILFNNIDTYYLFYVNLFKYLKLTELKALSVLSKQWKVATDNQIAKKSVFTMHGNFDNEGIPFRMTRRYCNIFFLNVTNKNDISTALMTLSDKQSQDSKNHSLNVFVKELQFQDSIIIKKHLMLIKQLENIETLGFKDCSMNFHFAECIHLSLKTVKFEWGFDSLNERQICSRFLSCNKASLETIYIGLANEIPLKQMVFPKLTKIRLRLPRDTGIDIFLMNNPQITSIFFYSMTIPLEVFRALEKHCLSLRSVVIKGCSFQYSLTDPHPIYISRNLRSIKMIGSKPDRLTISNFVNIKEFGIGSMEVDKLDACLPYMSNLTYLNLTSLRNGLSFRFLGTVAKWCPKLEYLILKEATPDTSIPGGDITFENLEVFHADHSRFHDMFLFHLQAPRLLKVNLDCTLITDIGLRHLTKFPLLTNIELICCQRLTDTGVAELIDNAKRLVFLDLTHCRRLTRNTYYKVIPKKLLSCRLYGIRIDTADVHMIIPKMDRKSLRIDTFLKMFLQDRLVIKNSLRTLELDWPSDLSSRGSVVNSFINSSVILIIASPTPISMPKEDFLEAFK